MKSVIPILFLFPAVMVPALFGAGARRLGVVAIGSYNDGHYDVVAAAENSARELEALLGSSFGFQLFQDGGSTRERPVGSGAKRSRIRQYIGALAAADRDDEILLYWSGHGLTINGVGYLVPFDAPSPAQPDDLISINWLLDVLDRSPAAKIMIIIDACKSGPSVHPEGSEMSRGTRVLLTSAAANQEASPSGGYRNATLFSGHLIRVLETSGCDFQGDGYCDAMDVAWAVQRKVRTDRPTQTPQLHVFGSGDPAADFRLRRNSADVRAWEEARKCDVPESECVDSFRLDEFIRVDPARPFAEAASRLRRERINRSLRLGKLVVTNDIQSIRGLAAKDSVMRLEDAAMYQWIPREPQPFWMGRYEVNVGQYRNFRHGLMPPAPSFNRGWRMFRYPVVNVSWADASAYCAALGGRLPTLEEWKFAASAGVLSTKYPWGLDEWHEGGANLAGTRRNVALSPESVFSHSSGQNEFNLFNMLGNVSEWTRPDEKVVRGNILLRASVAGGSFASLRDRTSLATQEEVELKGGNTVGFRCVIEPAGQGVAATSGRTE